MGYKLFTSGPFNVQLCADYCTAQNTYNLAHPPTDGSPVQTCQFFNTYILYKNTPSNSQGQYCAIYSEAWGSSYATNTGQYRGSDQYLINYSYSFTNSTGMISPNKNGAVHQASKDITYSSLQGYCSTLLGYSTPLATVTATATVTPLTTTSTTVFATETVTVTGAAVNQKRQNAIITVHTSDYPDHLLPTAAVNKRDLSTPVVLSKFPATVVSSACSLVATPVTSTSTITLSATTSAPTLVLVATQSATSTFTVSVPGPRTCANNPVFTESSNCKCAYTKSCGRLTSASCYYGVGVTSSFDSCLNQCDYFYNCGGVNYSADGTCTLCESSTFQGSARGDGSLGVVAGFRNQGSCGLDCLYASPS